MKEKTMHIVFTDEDFVIITYDTYKIENNCLSVTHMGSNRIYPLWNIYEIDDNYNLLEK